MALVEGHWSSAVPARKTPVVRPSNSVVTRIVAETTDFARARSALGRGARRVGQRVMPQTLSEANGGSEYHVAFATLIRNEARWLPEWLAYHALPSIGVGHFYLYDDGSSDELRTAIAPHVARGLVTLHSRFDVAMGLDRDRRSTNMVVAGDSSEAGREQCEYRRRHGLFHRWTNGTCYIHLLFPLQSYMVAHAIDHHGNSATYLGFVDVDVRVRLEPMTIDRLPAHC